MTKPSSSPPHGNAIYPWEKWSNGRAYMLVRGEDFDNEPTKFRTVVMATAHRMGRKVTTRVKGNTVWFQFAPVEAAPAKPKKPAKK